MLDNLRKCKTFYKQKTDVLGLNIIITDFIIHTKNEIIRNRSAKQKTIDEFIKNNVSCNSFVVTR